MRVTYWLAEVRERIGCDAAADLQDVPALAEVSALEFGLYAQQRRRPSDATLKLVEQVVPQTRTAYEIGPYEINLWGILEGDRKTCMDTLDAELQRLGEDLTRRRFTLGEKAGQLWMLMLPEHLHHWKSLDELLDMAPFNIVARTYAIGQGEYTRINRVKGRVYSAPVIAGVIALWMLCKQQPDDDGFLRSRYMLEGVLEEALLEEFPSGLGDLLTAHLRSEIAATQ